VSTLANGGGTLSSLSSSFLTHLSFTPNKTEANKKGELH